MSTEDCRYTKGWYDDLFTGLDEESYAPIHARAMELIDLAHQLAQDPTGYEMAVELNRNAPTIREMLDDLNGRSEPTPDPRPVPGRRGWYVIDGGLT